MWSLDSARGTGAESNQTQLGRVDVKRTHPVLVTVPTVSDIFRNRMSLRIAEFLQIELHREIGKPLMNINYTLLIERTK